MNTPLKTVFAGSLGLALLASGTASATFYNTGTKYAPSEQQQQSAPIVRQVAPSRNAAPVTATHADSGRSLQSFIDETSALRSGSTATVSVGSGANLQDTLNNLQSLSGSSSDLDNLLTGQIADLVRQTNNSLTTQISSSGSTVVITGSSSSGGTVISSSGGTVTTSSGGSSSSSGGFASSGGGSSSGGGQVPVPGPLSFLIAAAGLFMLRRKAA